MRGTDKISQSKEVSKMRQIENNPDCFKDYARKGLQCASCDFKDKCFIETKKIKEDKLRKLFTDK